MLTISKNLETSRFEKICKDTNISSVLNTCACPCLKHSYAFIPHMGDFCPFFFSILFPCK